MERLRALFDAPLPDADAWPLLRDFHHEGRCTGDGSLLTELAAALAQADCPAQMLARLTDFYRTRGVGLLGLGQVFRAESAPGGARLTPVEERLPVRLGDLVGYEKQKQQLLANTESFLAGHHANNVLLYGDAGTGKSTSIQAIANEYAAQGLRLIEIYKDQYALIPAILRQIKSRNYRFILFLDDLSFEENETSYKYLKAVMEGGAEAAPENVRIYATSNRRHLVREIWRDRSDMEHDGDIHRLGHDGGEALPLEPLRPADFLPRTDIRRVSGHRLRALPPHRRGQPDGRGAAQGRRHMAGARRQPLRPHRPPVRRRAGLQNTDRRKISKQRDVTAGHVSLFV